MTLLIDKIKVLRPYLTHMQAELLCRDLRADATNEEIMETVLPHEGLQLGIGASLADYLHRHRLDSELTLREFWDLTIEIDRMHNDGKSIDEMRDMVNAHIGIS